MDTRFFPLIFDAVPVGVFTVDRDRRITSFNRAAEELTGFTREEALGTPCHRVLCASVCHDACPLLRSIETGEAARDWEVSIKTKSGAALPVAVTTAAVRDADRVIGGVEILRNLSQLVVLRKQLSETYEVEDVVTKNKSMREMLKRLELYARSNAPILIEGSSGTGKELIARTVHNLGPRRHRSWVSVHCAALPPELLEAELFGAERGGLEKGHGETRGSLFRAHRGTIFLDEVADFPPVVQVKLLRFLLDGEIQPLGSRSVRRVDVRLIAASRKNLAAEVAAGRFRRDLYDHLKILHLWLPDLAQRTEDIPLLAAHFMRRFNAVHGKSIVRISDQAMAVLMQAPYPGNVRELENAIEHAFIVCSGDVIETSDLPRQFNHRPPDPQVALDNPLDAAEAAAIRSALALTRGNRTKAAQALNISRHTLWRKMKRLGLIRNE